MLCGHRCGKVSSTKGRILIINSDKTDIGKGYLNGLKDMQKALKIHLIHQIMYWQVFIKAPKSMIVDIYAFIPSSHATSQKVTYYLYKDSISSSNQLSNIYYWSKVLLKDKWASLFF